MTHHLLISRFVKSFAPDYHPAMLRSDFDTAFEDFSKEDWDAVARATFTNHQSIKHLTFLYLSAQAGWSDVVQKLLSHGASVLHAVTINDKATDAIQIAAEKGNLRILQYLIEDCIVKKAWDRDSAKYITLAYKCTPDVFELLLNYLNVYSLIKKQYTEAMPDWVSFIAFKRHDIFCHLLKKGIIASYLDGDDFNYLQRVIRLSLKPQANSLNEDELISLLPKLIDAGVDAGFVAIHDITALWMAIHCSYFRLANLIIESDILNIKRRTKSNILVYHKLLDEKNYSFLADLIKKGFMSDTSERAASPLISMLLWRGISSEAVNAEYIALLSEAAHGVNHAFDQKYKEIISPILDYTNSVDIITNFKMYHDSSDFYEALYNKQLIINAHASKKSTLELAIADCYNIMSQPNLCVSLLDEFEKQLELNWKQGLEVLRYPHSLKRHLGLLWPVPYDTVQSDMFFKKEGFLEMQCLDFMRKRGLAKHFVKFYNTVFDGTFEKLISDGAMFTESNINPHLLIHGKNTHNIGRMIIIRAWELGLIDNSISLEDIFAAMIDPQFSNPMTKRTPWTEIFDLSGAQIPTFTEPEQVHSHLMVCCKTSLPFLSTHMSHSFGKAILRMRDFVNDLTHENWTTQEVWDRYIRPRFPNIVFSDTKAELGWLRKIGKIPAESPLSTEAPVAPHRFSKL